MERIRQVEFVDPAHHRQIIRVSGYWTIINRRTRDLQKLALRHHRQDRVGMVYQTNPFGRLHGPDLFRKKSRSTIS